MRNFKNPKPYVTPSLPQITCQTARGGKRPGYHKPTQSFEFMAPRQIERISQNDKEFLPPVNLNSTLDNKFVTTY